MIDTARGTLKVHYVNGQEQTFEFPNQGKNMDRFILVNYIRDILRENQLLIKLEDRVVIIPFQNVQYIEVSPPPVQLPGNTLSDARLIE